MFKKLLYFFYLTIMISSCGKFPPQPFYNGEDIPHEIDPYFSPLIEHFEQDAMLHNIGVGDVGRITVFKFGEVPSGDISYCSYKIENPKFLGIVLYENFYKEIIFSEEAKNLTELQQYKVFLHEVGHCAYHLEHSSDIDDIMYIDSGINSSVPFFITENSYFKEADNNSRNWFSEANL